MARLFITSREIQLVNDWTKEFVKDIVGQYIIYYPVSTMKTNVDLVYDEAVEKIFNNPIKLDALVGQVERENANDKYGVYQQKGTVEVFVQARDLLDKNLQLVIGDYFVYGNFTYEIQDIVQTKNIFGQEDYALSYVMTADMVTANQFDMNVFKNLWDDARQFKDKFGNKTFEQQRGFAETEENKETGDVRQLRERLGEQMAPIALNQGPRKIVPDNIDNPSTEPDDGNSFYNE